MQEDLEDNNSPHMRKFQQKNCFFADTPIMCTGLKFRTRTRPRVPSWDRGSGSRRVPPGPDPVDL